MKYLFGMFKHSRTPRDPFSFEIADKKIESLGKLSIIDGVLESGR